MAATPKSTLMRLSALAATAALASVLATDAASAAACIPFLGCLHVPMPGGPARPRPPAPAPHQQPTGDSGGAAPASPQSVLADLGPPSQQQTAVLKDIYSSKTLGAVGAMDDLIEVNRARAAQADRDYAGVIAQIVANIAGFDKNGVQLKSEDISDHAINESLTNALTAANLPRFETFRGENWSAERLRKMVLDYANNEVEARKQGAQAEILKMKDIDTILQKSSSEVYYRVFETSEMLAAASGQNWFLQRLYKLQGAQVKDDLRENIEHWLEEASALGPQKVDNLALGESSRAIGAYRFRAERIVFDCLTENVAEIGKSPNGKIAAPEEIHQRIQAIAAQKCVPWVMAEFADRDGKLKTKDDAPKPYPLRVIWTANGPKNDGDLYGPAADKV